MVIRTILCPIDFTDISTRGLESAANVARAFGARLVLHHSRMAIGHRPAGTRDRVASQGAQIASEVAVEREMGAALAALPADVAREVVISAEPVLPSVLSLAASLPADLIVIGSHGWSTRTHTSVTERILERAPCPVLALHDGRQDPLGLDASRTVPARTVVPTDFSQTAGYALAYAYELARALPIRLELLHVLPGGSRRAAAAGDAARGRLDAGVPADLAARVATCVRFGRPTTVLLSHLREVRPQFAILGQHARDVWRHLLTHDTTRHVVHEACCPVWVVPARTHLDVKRGAFAGSQDVASRARRARR